MTNDNITLRDTPAGESGMRTITTPRADVYETPEAYVIRLDMPGARKEAVALTLEGDILEVSADVHSTGEGLTVLHRELRTAGYHRVFTLGDGIDRDHVDALFEEGVLTVKLFKTPGAKPRTIPIN
jgi:HSP20 family protein